MTWRSFATPARSGGPLPRGILERNLTGVLEWVVRQLPRTPRALGLVALVSLSCGAGAGCGLDTAARGGGVGGLDAGAAGASGTSSVGGAGGSAGTGGTSGVGGIAGTGGIGAAGGASGSAGSGGTASCTDGVKNGTETDVDCGGGSCPGCATGATCTAPADCASGFCETGACAASPPCGGSPIAIGNWTLLTNSAAATIDPAKSKQYLYVAPNNHWYLSPVTGLSWTWASYQAQGGQYAYCDGTQTELFSCTPLEDGDFGVGCSNGPGATKKTLPIYSSNPPAGQCEICQDVPNAFGGAACEMGVSIYFRYR